MRKKRRIALALARTFTEEPGGWMRIKTFGVGGQLMSERVVPLREGRQIMQGDRPGMPELGPYLGNVD